MNTAIKRDTIMLSEFLPSTRDGFMRISERYDLMDMDSTSDPYHWAGYVLLLKRVLDAPELFPHGKWATIQRIESMLDEWASGLVKEEQES